MITVAWSALRGHVKALFAPASNRLAAIDGVRALSQLAVMLYHCFFLARISGEPEQFRAMVQNTPWYLGWVWSLDYSVDAFFVISGYLIATLLYREYNKSGSIDLKRFYWRRYLRLTPAYFAFILLVLAVSPAAHPTVWANFLYVNNFIPLAEASIPWTWSLAVEEQFYLVFPALLLLLVMRARRPFLRLCFLLAASLFCAFWVFYSDPLLWQLTPQQIYFDNATFNHYYDRFYVNLYTRFGPFVSGAMAAYLMVYHRGTLERMRQQPLLFNGINLVALAVLFYTLAFNPYRHDVSLAYSRWHLIVDRNLFGIALGWVLLATQGPAGLLHPLKQFLGWKGWYPIAQLSYTMYLFHYAVVLFVMANVMGNLQHFGLLESGQPFPYVWFIPAYLLVVILTLIPATLLHVTVEKPFMNLRDRLSRAPVSAAPPIAGKA